VQRSDHPKSLRASGAAPQGSEISDADALHSRLRIERFR
jgi:hypothetical protein